MGHVIVSYRKPEFQLELSGRKSQVWVLKRNEEEKSKIKTQTSDGGGGGGQWGGVTVLPTVREVRLIPVQAAV